MPLPFWVPFQCMPDMADPSRECSDLVMSFSFHGILSLPHSAFFSKFSFLPGLAALPRKNPKLAGFLFRMRLSARALQLQDLSSLLISFITSLVLTFSSS